MVISFTYFVILNISDYVLEECIEEGGREIPKSTFDIICVNDEMVKWCAPPPVTRPTYFFVNSIYLEACSCLPINLVQYIVILRRKRKCI